MGGRSFVRWQEGGVFKHYDQLFRAVPRYVEGRLVELVDLRRVHYSRAW